MTSKNEVVANALNAVAKNATYALGHKFEVGDEVASKGNPSYRGKIVDAEVHGNRGTFYIVKWNDGDTYRVIEGDLVKNAKDEAVATNADDYKTIAAETKKVFAHLKAADDITVANVLKAIHSDTELSSKANEMWKHISEARKIATYIIQY